MKCKNCGNALRKVRGVWRDDTDYLESICPRHERGRSSNHVPQVDSEMDDDGYPLPPAVVSVDV